MNSYKRDNAIIAAIAWANAFIVVAVKTMFFSNADNLLLVVFIWLALVFLSTVLYSLLRLKEE